MLEALLLFSLVVTMLTTILHVFPALEQTLFRGCIVTMMVTTIFNSYHTEIPHAAKGSQNTPL